MTAARVDRAVVAIERRDADLGRWVRAAADALTAGEGEEVLYQAAIQDFVWYYLPAKYPEGSWTPMARAAKVLFDELGYPRYAAIAGSSTTAVILEAWRTGDSQGLARFRAAVDASGVKPPDTDLLAWGTVMGMEEASALASIECALEQAIVDGRLVPGASGWKARAAALTEQALRESTSDGEGRSRLQRVLDERCESWLRAGYPDELRRRRAKAVARFDHPPDSPDDLGAVIGPMRWLLETCRDGIELTQSGYLPPVVVRQAVERFDWWDWPGQPRSEVDVHQLGALREAAARLRLITKRGRRLATSRAGVEMLAEDLALWRAIVRSALATDEYATVVSEMMAHRLLDGPALDDELQASIVPIIAAQGWRSGGQPLDERQIALSMHEPMYLWRLFGLLDEVRPPWIDGHPSGRNITSLTAAGRAAALEYVRARAEAPRTSLIP